VTYFICMLLLALLGVLAAMNIIAVMVYPQWVVYGLMVNVVLPFARAIAVGDDMEQQVERLREELERWKRRYEDLADELTVSRGLMGDT